MQELYEFSPMVKQFIVENMPYNGYKLVAKRLSNEQESIKRTDVVWAVRYIAQKPNDIILAECLRFIKESNIPLNKYAQEFLEKEKAKV